MRNEPFSLTDNGVPLTAEQAEASLVQILSSPELCERNWDELREIDVGLQCTAVLCNPELAEMMWPSLSDNLKFVCITSTPEKDARTIKAVVHSVMAFYCEHEGARNG